jgi:hypothetical protein
MAQHHNTVARSTSILELLEQVGPLTNREIAEALCLKYRAVQRTTCKLALDGYISGVVDSYGRFYSNVSWRVKYADDDALEDSSPERATAS